MRLLRFPPNNEDRGSATQDAPQEGSTYQESDDALVLARAIHGAGMSGVASFALSMLKPLHWIGGQAIWILQPFIETTSVGVGGAARHGAITRSLGLSTGAVARLLEREGGVDELAARLDELDKGGEGGPQKEGGAVK